MSLGGLLFLKGNREGVDLGERGGDGGLEGMEGGETRQDEMYERRIDR